MSSTKHKLLIMGYILTFGILYALRLIFPLILIYLTCTVGDPEDANLVKIDEKNGTITLVDGEKVDGYDKSRFFPTASPTPKSKGSDSKLIGTERSNKTEFCKLFTYKNNKYIYNETKNSFSPIAGNLGSYSNKNIHEFFGSRPPTFDEYKYQLNKFGENTIIIGTKGVARILLEHFFSVGNFYCYFSSVILFINSQTTYPIVIILFTFSKMIVDTYFTKKYYKNIFKIEPSQTVSVLRQFEPFSENSENSKKEEKKNKSKVGDNRKTDGSKSKLGHDSKKANLISSRSYSVSNKNDFTEHSSKYLVPGDILFIGDSTVMPCDGIILEGSCNVDESGGNGENRSKIKVEVPHDGADFSFGANKKSILFQGTKINEIQSSDRKQPYLLVGVINTGFYTYRSSLIENYNDKKNRNYHFYEDLKKIIFILLLVWLLCGLYFGAFSEYSFKNFIYVLNILTTIISPSGSICINICCFFFHLKLRKRKINCISNGKLLTAGRINTILVDKAGTLTEECLKGYGFQSVINDEIDETSFEDMVMDEKYFKNKFYDYWQRKGAKKNFPANDEDKLNDGILNKQVYFMECLACCNYINKVKDDQISGNFIDMIIYNRFNWEFETVKSSVNDQDKRIYIYPKNSYKIIMNESITDVKTPYKIEYIQRYQFAPQTQTQSVIVKNTIDGTYRLYVKGATDKIMNYCDLDSIPENYEDKVSSHNQVGYRLIACASKILSKEEIEGIQDSTNNGDNLTKDMIFLGFVIFINCPKKDTKNIITNLQNVGIKIILATDENPFAAISIAEDCEIISKENNHKYFGIDYSKEGDGKPPKFQIDQLELYNNEDNFLDDSFEFSARSRGQSGRKNEGRNVTESSVRTVRRGGGIQKDPENTKAIYKKHFGTTILDKEALIGIDAIRRNLDLQNKMEISDDDINQIKPEDKPILCLNGSALLRVYQYSKDKSEGINGLQNNKLRGLSLVQNYGKIFYRLKTNDKTNLIKFLQQDNFTIIANVGETSIDSSSGMASDLSISLRQISGNCNIISHFSSAGSSLSCVQRIIKIGRACYENNGILIKYIILIGGTRLIMQLKFLDVPDLITTNQYMFLDIFCVFIPVCLSSMTGANYNISRDEPPHSMINREGIFSMIGQVIIQLLAQSLFIFIVNLDNLKPKFDSEEELIQSNMFILNVFQYLSLLFIFNISSSHRKKIYLNKFFMLYFVCLCLYSSCLITVKEFNGYFFGGTLIDFKETDDTIEQQNELGKMITLLVSTGSCFISFLYEITIVKICYIK